MKKQFVVVTGFTSEQIGELALECLYYACSVTFDRFENDTESGIIAKIEGEEAHRFAESLEDFGITIDDDGRVHGSGKEMRVPVHLLPFSLETEDEVIHLPGSEDGSRETWPSLESFQRYCQDMAE